MSKYKYKALGPDGEIVQGVVEAVDEETAANKIKAEYNTILEIKGDKSITFGGISLTDPIKISEKVLSLVSSQFAILLRAGMPISRTVGIIAEQTADKSMKKLLTIAAEDVNAGYSLAQSIEMRGKAIPIAFIETIRAGEESGTMEKSFEKLATYFEKSYKIKSKVKGALAYPAFLSVLAVVVIAIIVAFCLPVMTGIITSAGNQIPLPTRILLGITDFVSAHWMKMLIILAAAIAAIFIYKRTPDGRLLFGNIGLNIPILGKVNRLNAASQFANTMVTLLSAGLPMNRVLNIVSKVIDNAAVGKSVLDAVPEIELGRSLGAVFYNSSYLPPLLVEMLDVGEEAGSLEETLQTIGTYYEEETMRASTKALSMLEPVLTVVMGLVIGFIVIALYMPMFTMYTGM